MKYFLDRDESLWSQDEDTKVYECVTDPYKVTPEAWGPLDELSRKGHVGVDIDDLDSEEFEVITEINGAGEVIVSYTVPKLASGGVVAPGSYSFTSSTGASFYPTASMPPSYRASSVPKISVDWDAILKGPEGKEIVIDTPDPKRSYWADEIEGQERRGILRRMKESTLKKNAKALDADIEKARSEVRPQRVLLGMDPGSPAPKITAIAPIAPGLPGSYSVYVPSSEL